MNLFVWISSAYLITSVAGMPIYGKLSDMYGRKFFFLMGIILFTLGSLLCGTAQTMLQLITFRAIQGIGGGAIMPIAFSIVFDIVSLQERGKFTGLFGAAFGISSIFGPLIGSVLTDYASWRYVLLLNIPLGLLAAVFIFIGYHESSEHSRQQIDWFGALFLVLSVVSFMFALELGGKNYGWTSWQIMSLFLSFFVFLILFLIAETKVPEPIIPLFLFQNRLFACSQALAFFYGSVFIITVIYIPIFIQGVYGGTATNSGLILMPMMLASVVGSQIGGNLVSRFSYRTLMIGSIVTFFSGLFLLSTLTVHSPYILILCYMLITGIGVGISFSVLMMSSADQVAPQNIGSANSSVTFFRSLGMTLGITILGSVQNHIMQADFIKAFPNYLNKGMKLEARTLLQPQIRAHIPAQELSQMTKLLASSITDIFRFTLIPLTISFVFIIIMGNRKLKNSKEVIYHVNENGRTGNTYGGE
jgi:EmrB/QacA subfamily drug resistance transporter